MGTIACTEKPIAVRQERADAEAAAAVAAAAAAVARSDQVVDE